MLCSKPNPCAQSWKAPLESECLLHVTLPIGVCAALHILFIVCSAVVRLCCRAPVQRERSPWNFRSYTALMLLVTVVASCVSASSLYGSSMYWPAAAMLVITVSLLNSIIVFSREMRAQYENDMVCLFWLLLLLTTIAKAYHTLGSILAPASSTSCWVMAIPQAVILCDVVSAIALSSVCVILSFSETVPGTEKERESPENYASFFSRMIFHWNTPLVVLGNKSKLDADSLWFLDDSHKADAVAARHRYFLEEEFPRRDPQRAKEGSLLKALVRTFWPEALYGACLKFFQDVCTLAGPVLLRGLLTFVASDEPLWVGIGFCLALLCSSVLQCILNQQQIITMLRLGMDVRVSMVTAVYDKALLLSSTGRRQWTTGEIVNLMSKDAHVLFQTVKQLNMMWSAPFLIIVAFSLIYQDLGVSSFAGLAVILCLMPINTSLASLQKRYQGQQMKDKDARIKMVNEVLNGIKVLKLYAWELGFKDVIDNIRAKEVTNLRKSAIISAALTFLWFVAPFLVSLAAFGCYVLVSPENILTSDKAFVSLALFQLLRQPLAHLPSLITTMVQGMVSVRRLSDFLRSEELEDYILREDDSKHAIKLVNATFSWHTAPTLKNICLEVPKGSLVAIVGQVGSGKSSLISALLGEMKRKCGEVRVFGRLSYVPQVAWLRNASVRDNVLFGEKFDEKRYQDIIRRCALDSDLNVLPSGDSTEIGEKGINLSGGQKQRISIARAVYSDADIYLFDDLLSAVDVHVGKHIFTEVIGNNGLLSSKTRVLVTHGIHYLPHVDFIYVLKDGQISERGSYKDLIRQRGEFYALTKEFSQSRDLNPEDQEELDELSSTESKGNSVPKARRLAPSENNNKRIIDSEEAAVGRVKTRVYVSYLRYFGFLSAAIASLGMAMSAVFQVGSNVWLAAWSQDSSTDSSLRDFRLMVYGLLGLGQGLCLFFGLLLIVCGGLNASLILHNKLLYSTLRAPLSFFDSTPIGRIVNRFAHDLDVADQTLGDVLHMWLQTLLQLMSAVIVICINAPLFILVLVPISAVFYAVQRLYIPTSRQLRRLESINRSPIFSHFGETLMGASSIRAYQLQGRFTEESNSAVDRCQMCFYRRTCTIRWLGVRLDLCASLIIFFTALFVSVSRGSLDPGVIGLCMSYALTSTTVLNMFLRLAADLEVNLVSVERLLEYAEVAPEAEWRSERYAPSDHWPPEGRIQFMGYSSQYRDGLPCVVKNINIDIKSGEKVAVIGRTGAGKSSLALALFRILEGREGRILIDGVDISQVGLHDLREKLCIIPQDPVLFAGTLRLNLDPFNSLSDDVLWKALEQSHLGTFVAELDGGLESRIEEGGGNLSVGQRQLLCLARALLRRCRILVLDEATSSVDVETDQMIQTTVKTEFSECTIITIAHRINTVIDYDRILVLDHGNVLEFDSPQKLLEDSTSVFYSIVHESNMLERKTS